MTNIINPWCCPKCNNIGLIPFTNKEGKLIPDVWLDCSCKKEEPEHYYPFALEDFDFPMSYSVYRSLCQQHGWPDPGPAELPPIQEETKPVVRRLPDKESKVIARSIKQREPKPGSKPRFKGAI